MPEIEKNFSLDIPTKIDDLKFFFVVTRTLHTSGSKSATNPHNHGDYEIRYTIQGKGCQMIGIDAIYTSPGDILLIPPYVYHHQPLRAISEDLEQYSLRFSIKPPLDKSDAEQKKKYKLMKEMLSQIHKLSDSAFLLLPYFKKLTEEINEKKYGYFNYLQSICSIILTELIRISGITNPSIFPSMEVKYNRNYRLLIDHFFHKRFRENIKLQELADAMKVSPRQVTRIMMKEFGVSYTQKLLETRLEYAKSELAHTDKSIQQISVDCGFQSYSYFITCFRKSTNMTPMEYRKKLCADSIL